MKTDTQDKSGRTTHRPTAFLLSLLFSCGVAWSQFVPPDLFGDTAQGPCMLRRNDGQVFDTDGNQRPDVKYVFEGSPVGIYLRDSSRVSYTFNVMHNDSAAADTAYRVDMTFRAARIVSPTVLDSAAGIANYYIGSTAAEQVPAYYRGVYQNIKSGIDLHYYGSSSGPRMAIVIKPGVDPSLVKLAFTGQDSLGIDWLGALKVYILDHWVELQRGTAYQVDTNGTIIPVGWTPAYAHQDSTAYVGFTFGTYNTALPLVVQIGYGPLALGGGGNTRDMDWSTYMGGGADDEFTCVETDEDGNAYTCGYTYSVDFPVHPGNAHYDPFNGTFIGHDDAVIAKFKGDTKRVEWATFYGGTTPVNIFPDNNEPPRTEARKLAPYTSTLTDHQYVFVTGATNCTDFNTWTEPLTIFSGATQEDYVGGRSRMWVGAFTKEDGRRRWATTHGQTNANTSVEEGTSIVVDPAGLVAVGGRLFNSVNSALTSPAFPMYTPAGAYAHTGGGGFVLSFNADYTLRWATTVGSLSTTGVYSEVNDMRYIKDGRFLWFTGVSSGSSSTIDLVTQPGGYNGTHGSVMLG